MAERHRQNTEAPLGNVYLVGFMCSGKTLAGRALAALTRRPFADSDARIASMTGNSPAAIIRQHGLSRFRAHEEKAVRALARRGGLVVALGGGFYPSGRRTDLLKKTGITVFLDCPWPELERRMKSSRRTRPLLDGDWDKAAARAERLYSARRPFYRKADITLNTSGLTPAQTAARIKKALR